MVQRQTLARRDTVERRNKISSARVFIYEKGYAVDTAQVEAKLKDESLVPTVVCVISKSILRIINNSNDVLDQNAFSDRLGHTDFDFFLMLVVDLLHEFELGVWKAVLIHLLRIVDSAEETSLAELDSR